MSAGCRSRVHLGAMASNTAAGHFRLVPQTVGTVDVNQDWAQVKTRDAATLVHASVRAKGTREALALFWVHGGQ